jgi:hypothetical protein
MILSILGQFHVILVEIIRNCYFEDLIKEPTLSTSNKEKILSYTKNFLSVLGTVFKNVTIKKVTYLI